MTQMGQLTKQFLVLFVGLFTAAALLSSCTGALDKEQIRQGNYNAPPNLQVAEDCKSSDTTRDCKVIISHPPPREDK